MSTTLSEENKELMVKLGNYEAAFFRVIDYVNKVKNSGMGKEKSLDYITKFVEETVKELKGTED